VINVLEAFSKSSAVAVAALLLTSSVKPAEDYELGDTIVVVGFSRGKNSSLL
jgi:hypothetical protein